jgi:hypothetical protein
MTCVKTLLLLTLMGCHPVPSISLVNECADPSSTWSPYRVGMGTVIQKGKLVGCPVVPVLVITVHD